MNIGVPPPEPTYDWEDIIQLGELPGARVGQPTMPGRSPVSLGKIPTLSSPGIFTMPSISQILERITLPGIGKPTKVVGRAPTPVQINVPQQRSPPVQVVSNPVLPRPPVIPSPPITVGGLDRTSTIFGESEMGLDLGALLGAGITAYGNIATAKALPVSYMNTFQPQAFNPFSDVPLTSAFETGGVPSVAQVGGIPKGYKINCDGKLVKCRKRRRRRLATASDIKDLASLSSVTTGKQKETWIATHPS